MPNYPNEKHRVMRKESVWQRWSRKIKRLIRY